MSLVPYQLYRCPWNCSSLSIVVNVCSSRSTMSIVPIQPRSRAVTVDSRYIPMLVGDVRWATTGAGSSWKLSGGSQLSDAPTNVSKKSHVRRAVRRSDSISPEVSWAAATTEAGVLTTRATNGDSSHSARNGTANHSVPGLTMMTTIDVPRAITTAL